MKNYYDLSPQCKYNRVMKIAEVIGKDDWNVYEDACRARTTLCPEMEMVRTLRTSILIYAAQVKNERWERMLGE